MSTAPPPPNDPQAAYGQFAPYGQATEPFPHGGGTQPVTRMPGSVRAAKIVAFVLVGLTIAGSVLGGVLGGPRLAGAALGGSVLLLVTPLDTICKLP